jgi:hypothetical protein
MPRNPWLGRPEGTLNDTTMLFVVIFSIVLLLVLFVRRREL